jgi:hypothetical protein
MSELARLAKVRNWSKYRLMGANFPREGLTLDELDEIAFIRYKIREILDKWDDRSRELNLVPKQKKLL